MTSSTTPISSAAPAVSAARSPTLAGTTALGKQDFLKLLMAQLRNQDPMNPMQDRDFITQMAQFSSLESLDNLNQQLESSSRMAALSQASALIGRDVEFSTGDGSTKHGVVTEVRIGGGSPRLVIDGHEASLADVVSVKGGGSASTIPGAASSSEAT